MVSSVSHNSPVASSPQEPSQLESAPPSVPQASTSGAQAPTVPPGQPQSDGASMRRRLMQLLNDQPLENQPLEVLKRWEEENNTGPHADEYWEVAEIIRNCLKTPTITTLTICAPNITSLPPIPAHITELDLTWCSALPSPPDLSKCPSLRSLNLFCCRALTNLPDLSKCPLLRSLNLSGCSALPSPPDLSKCPLLDSLDLSGCSALPSPPDLSKCPLLRSLNLSYCSALIDPPNVFGCSKLDSLDLSGCSALIDPPNVFGCSKLTSLNLSGCSALTSPPIMARHPQLARLNMSGVPLISLPETLLSFPQNCIISLTANNLSLVVRNRVRAAMSVPSYEGPWRISFDMGAPSEIVVKSISEEVALWKQESGATGNAQSDALWESLQKHVYAGRFAQFLARLRETSEYKSARLQPDFQQRIGRLLAQLEQAGSTALRELCFNEAEEAVDTCGDRVALSLLNMETTCATQQAEVQVRNGGYDNRLQDLVDLGKGMYRLEQLKKISHAKVQTLNFVDEIEVHLGYLVHFSEEFKLPVQMQTMLYPHCSAITEADVTAARNALTSHAEEGDNHNRALLDFLANWSPMDMMLEKQYPDVFAALKIEIKTETETEQAPLKAQIENLDRNAADDEQKGKSLLAKLNQIPSTINAQEKRPLITDLLNKQNVTARLQ